MTSTLDPERHWKPDAGETNELPQAQSAGATTEQGAAPLVGTGSWLCWLSEKMEEAEKAIKAREQAGAAWRTGTNAEWKAACDMLPSTAGRALKKSERLSIAATQDRIAEKYRRDLAMLKAIAAALSQHNGAGQGRPGGSAEGRSL